MERKKKKKYHPETLDPGWKGTVYGHVKDYKDQDYQAGGKKEYFHTNSSMFRNYPPGQMELILEKTRREKH